MKLNKGDYTISCGNVFEDLGLPDAQGLNTKAELVLKISGIISRRRLTQVQAAKVLKIDQPKVSALLRGRLEKFSVERLVDFLTLLGCDVDIQVRERKSTKTGRLTVSLMRRPQAAKTLRSKKAAG